MLCMWRLGDGASESASPFDLVVLYRITLSLFHLPTWVMPGLFPCPWPHTIVEAQLINEVIVELLEALLRERPDLATAPASAEPVAAIYDMLAEVAACSASDVRDRHRALVDRCNPYVKQYVLFGPLRH